MKRLSIPFFFGATDTSNNDGKPEKVDFEYFYNKDLELFQQKPNSYVDDLLKSVYIDGSMMNGEMDFNTGGLQGQASLEFILKNLDRANLKIFEIGYGNGFLLKELHKIGFECSGVEPGPQCDILTNAYPQIRAVRDFFPSTQIKETYDVVMHFNVIEHVKDPVEFLLEQKNMLNPGGKIIFGMPNCEPNIATGDLSMFLHEHFQYFTTDSLLKLANKINLHIEDIAYGANNGMIFCSFSNRPSHCKLIKSDISWETFDYEKPLKNLQTELSSYEQSDVAVYCPKRALNALHILNIKNCRLVDDTKSLHGKYMPTFSYAVESFEQLLTNPPKLLLIFSRTFGQSIFRKCAETNELKNTKILLLKEFDER